MCRRRKIGTYCKDSAVESHRADRNSHVSFLIAAGNERRIGNGDRLGVDGDGHVDILYDFIVRRIGRSEGRFERTTSYVSDGECVIRPSKSARKRYVRKRLSVRCGQIRGYGVRRRCLFDRHGHVLCRRRVDVGLRSLHGDDCGACFDDGEVAIVVNGDCVATLDTVAQRTVAFGNLGVDFQAGVAVGSRHVVRFDSLTLTKRFEDGKRSVVTNFPHVVVGIVAHFHGDGIVAHCFAFFAGDGIIEVLALDDTALKYVERLIKFDVGIFLFCGRHFAAVRDGDVVYRIEVAIAIDTAILCVVPSEGVCACGEVDGVGSPVTNVAFFELLTAVNLKIDLVAPILSSVFIIEGEGGRLRQRDGERQGGGGSANAAVAGLGVHSVAFGDDLPRIGGVVVKAQTSDNRFIGNGKVGIFLILVFFLIVGNDDDRPLRNAEFAHFIVVSVK